MLLLLVWYAWQALGEVRLLARGVLARVDAWGWEGLRVARYLLLELIGLLVVLLEHRLSVLAILLLALAALLLDGRP